MPTALLALNIIILLAILALFLRKPASPQSSSNPRIDALPDQLTRIDARSEALDQHVRAAFDAMRRDLAEQSDRARKDYAESTAQLRADVQKQLDSITSRLTAFTADSNQQHTGLREALNSKLNELMTSNTTLQDRLRASMEERLAKLNTDNAAKLEEMRKTVDEKLHATLQSRLTESFGQVTDQLTKVHAGLGEMNSLTTGVNDLNRIFSNVKSRGGFAEMRLEDILDDVLAPGEYARNVNVKPETQEVVEFAVRFPGTVGGEVLLPIDAKFPREDWERLETAYEHGTAEEVEAARKAFDAGIRTEGKRICSKYINEPVTTPYAIMFLPTENLYAEVLRRDGLQAELHLNCRVMVAGPTNLYALLTGFRFGFRMLNLQRKGGEVWKTLAATQTEFGKFGKLMDTMAKQVGTVQNTIQLLGVRTRAINKTLLDVAEVDPADAKVLSIEGVLPLLAAAEED